MTRAEFYKRRALQFAYLLVTEREVRALAGGRVPPRVRKVAGRLDEDLAERLTRNARRRAKPVGAGERNA